MIPAVGKAAKTKIKTPRILVVDDEPMLIDLVGDVVGGQINCKVIPAKSIAEARQILASTPIELLVAECGEPQDS